MTQISPNSIPLHSLLPFPPLPFPIPFHASPFPSYKSSCGVWGSAVRSPSGVRGRAPATNTFWRIYGSQNAPRGSIFQLSPNISYDAKCVIPRRFRRRCLKGWHTVKKLVLRHVTITEPFDWSAVFESFFSVQVSGTSFLSVCHRYYVYHHHHHHVFVCTY